MRWRLYLCWFVLVCVISVYPAVIYQDFLDVAFRHRPMVAGDRIALPIYGFLVDGPMRAAYALGINIGTHHAQAWPSGWPPMLAYHLKMTLLFIPYWFVLGIPILELILFVRGKRTGVGREARA